MANELVFAKPDRSCDIANRLKVTFGDRISLADISIEVMSARVNEGRDPVQIQESVIGLLHRSGYRDNDYELVKNRYST